MKPITRHGSGCPMVRCQCTVSRNSCVLSHVNNICLGSSRLRTPVCGGRALSGFLGDVYIASLSSLFLAFWFLWHSSPLLNLLLLTAPPGRARKQLLCVHSCGSFPEGRGIEFYPKLCMYLFYKQGLTMKHRLASNLRPPIYAFWELVL